MRKRIILTVPLLFLATTICHAHSLTLKEADSIIILLLFVVIALIVVIVVGRRQHKISLRREEQLLRILNMLDEYRAMMADGVLTLDEQEELMKRYQPEVKKAKVISIDERKAFYVKMDARVNKEKPFTDPDFNQQALADFMEVDLETFRRLVPRY